MAYNSPSMTLFQEQILTPGSVFDLKLTCHAVLKTLHLARKSQPYILVIPPLLQIYVRR